MSTTDPRRLRVLVSAFACCPASSPRFSGGEDVLGWRLVEQIGRHHDAWVLTHAVDQEAIERERGRTGALAGVTIRYVGLPAWLRLLCRLQGGLQLYVYLWQLRAYAVARRLLRVQRFDLVHHLTYANDWMASYVGAWLDVPYVRGPGGGAHRVPAAFLPEFSWTGRALQRARSVLQAAFRRDPVFTRGQERAQRLLVCNREAMETLPPRWRAKASLFPVNGIAQEDVRALTEGGAPPSGGAFHVLSAGKLIRLKGFPLLLRAFAEFAVRRPGTLEIIGDGPDRSHLEGLVRSLGLAGRVRLTPWLPRGEFLARLRDCQVFAFASLRDGGGAVVVEAMGAGKPVVCLSLGGPRLHVTAATGIPVEAEAPGQAVREMAGALVRLHDDPSLRARLGVAARARALDDYTWDHLGDRLADVYASAVGHRVAGTSARPRAVVPA